MRPQATGRGQRQKRALAGADRSACLPLTRKGLGYPPAEDPDSANRGLYGLGRRRQAARRSTL